MATPIGNIAIDTTEKVLNIGVDFYGYDIVAVKPDVACQISVNDNAHYQNYDANELVNIPGPINRLYVKTASGTGTLRHWAYRGITPVNSINAVKMTDDMDLLNSELADIPNHANASQELKILNPYGTTQNIHPKVLYFQTAWHGYKWWMAYTPYTYSALAQENPCIAVSNDGINWTVPAGLTNPLEPYPGVSSKYNSDTHLVYRSDLDRLEIWWRYVDDTAHTTMLKRKTSLDGVTWDVNENIFAGDTSANDHMSPSVIFENGKYKMWCITNNPLKVKYYESATGLDGSWSFGIDVPISWGTINPWHMDVIHTDLGYEFIIHGYEDGGDNNHGNLYYVFSTDLINFTMPKLILKPSYRLNSFDNQGIYRSSIVKANGIYYMFYSSVSTNNTRSISLSYGVTPTALKGLDISNDQDIARFISLELMNYLYLEPASSPSATPYKAGALQYTNTVNKDGSTIQFHDGSVWRILAEKYLTSMAYIKRGTSIDITLSNGIESIITFSTRVKDYPQKWTNSNMYTAPSAGWYDVNVNFVLSTLATTSKIRVYLKINDVEALQIFEDTGNGGIKTVNTNAFIELQANDTLKVAIMLTGTDSPIIQSSKGYIHIEKKYNTIV